MDAAHAVLLLGVFIAIAVIAGYLIYVGVILKTVFSRLNTILGAVDAVTERSAPIGPVLDEINRDLAEGQRALEGAVERLRERLAPTVDDGPTGPPTSAGSAAAQQPWPEYPARGQGT